MQWHVKKTPILGKRGMALLSKRNVSQPPNEKQALTPNNYDFSPQLVLNSRLMIVLHLVKTHESALGCCTQLSAQTFLRKMAYISSALSIATMSRHDKLHSISLGCLLDPPSVSSHFETLL